MSPPDPGKEGPAARRPPGSGRRWARDAALAAGGFLAATALIVVWGRQSAAPLVPPGPGRGTASLAPSGAEGDEASASPPRPMAETARVGRVVDGDTLELADGRRVRVLGVDAPETEHAEDGPEPLSAAATARTEELVAGHPVRLEVDTTNRDRFGRLLRHVWVGNRLLAEVLVREGLGRAFIIPPDDRYSERLAAAERAARAEGLGLWALAGGDTEARPAMARAEGGHADLEAPCGRRVAGTLTAQEAEEAVGQLVATEFRVARTKDTGKVTFLNSAAQYEGHFYVAVFPDDYPDFPRPPAEYFDGACVVVRGRVKMYKGSPEVVLTSADDIARVGR